MSGGTSQTRLVHTHHIVYVKDSANICQSRLYTPPQKPSWYLYPKMNGRDVDTVGWWLPSFRVSGGETDSVVTAGRHLGDVTEWFL